MIDPTEFNKRDFDFRKTYVFENGKFLEEEILLDQTWRKLYDVGGTLVGVWCDQKGDLIRVTNVLAYGEAELEDLLESEIDIRGLFV